MVSRCFSKDKSSMIIECTKGLPISRWKWVRREAPSLIHPISLFIIFSLFSLSHAVVPHFHESNRMPFLRLPYNTPPDTIIYRLRAEDSERDYPLIFQVKDTIGINLIYLDQHECTPSGEIFCEADVYLRQKLVKNRLYSFNLSVSDTRGESTEVVARIKSTRGKISPISDVFVSYSQTVEVKEDAKVGSIISTMVCKIRADSNYGVFEILGPAKKLFKMKYRKSSPENSIDGTLSVIEQLDYEIANLHTFKVCLLNPFTIEVMDTRNIACVLISVVVYDVQDEPPIFVKAPPVTRVNSLAKPGDVLVKIEAADADRGAPREIRYSILPQSSFYTKYFRINSLDGTITINETASNLRDKMISLDPILMTVTAEEVIHHTELWPALSSLVEIAFVVLDPEILVPKFVHEKYVGEIYENSPPDKEVIFNSQFLVQGVKGVFQLELIGDNGAFYVDPSVVKDASEIKIKVKNGFLIDFEKSPHIIFELRARQVTGPRQASGSAEITVQVLDINDNFPIFSQKQYTVEIFENITRGTTIAKVFATDADSGLAGQVKYTTIFGDLADRLHMDETTGLITCATDNNGFDREKSPEFVLTVEAKDNNGIGTSANTASAKIIILLKDINDQRPRFLESIYKAVMAPDKQHLRDRLQIKAVDDDAESPNNEVVYNLEPTTYSEFFSIGRTTGVLDVRQSFVRVASLNKESKTKEKFSDEVVGKPRPKRAIYPDNDTVITLRVKASDRGTPILSDIVDVKIFLQDGGERMIKFIFPKAPSAIKQNELEETLNALTGGTTDVISINPYKTGFLQSTTDPNKSVVTAIVKYRVNTYIDLQKLMSTLNTSESHILQTEALKKEETITSLEGQNTSMLIGVIFLCLFLLIAITIFTLCCCCEGCPLSRSIKKNSMVEDDGSEGVSYVRVDENGKYNEADIPTWWKYTPKLFRDIFIACGYNPPGSGNSRMAWSGAETRERQWRINQPPEAVGVEDRGMPGMRPMQRDAVLLEDLDQGMQRQGLHLMGKQQQQPLRVDSRISQFSQEPRRVFVLRDPRGVQGGRDPLKEGETYLVEDMDETPRPIRNMDNMSIITEEEYQNNQRRQQGNAQVLRLHASQPDAVYYNDRQRVRRAGVEPEGAVMLRDNQQHRQRYPVRVQEGQSSAHTARSSNYGDYYVDDSYGYDVRYLDEDPIHSDAYIQTDNGGDGRENVGRRRKVREPIKEETRSLLKEDNSKESRKRVKRTVRPELHRSSQRSTRSDSEVEEGPSRRSTNSAATIPGTNAKHTKSSILRMEKNIEKIEDNIEDKLRKGQDPEICDHSGNSSRNGSQVDLAKIQNKSTNRSKEAKQGKSQQAQESKVGIERRGSLPEMETNLEREAAIRKNKVRHNSSGAEEEVLENNLQKQGRRSEEIVNKDEQNENIDRRRQQRRDEASAALSEEMRNIRVEGSLTPPPSEQRSQVSIDGRQSDELNSDLATRNADLSQASRSTDHTVTSESKQSNISEQHTTNNTTNNSTTNNTIINMPNDSNNNEQNNLDTSSTNKNLLKNVNLPAESASPQIIVDHSPAASQEELKIVEGEINLGVTRSSAVFEKNLRNDQSILNFPRKKKKINKLLEKKSVFTIAYDGMKTEQLRPESAAAEP